jgi:hypothetical protein
LKTVRPRSDLGPTIEPWTGKRTGSMTDPVLTTSVHIRRKKMEIQLFQLTKAYLYELVFFFLTKSWFILIKHRLNYFSTFFSNLPIWLLISLLSSMILFNLFALYISKFILERKCILLINLIIKLLLLILCISQNNFRDWDKLWTGKPSKHYLYLWTFIECYKNRTGSTSRTENRKITDPV